MRIEGLKSLSNFNEAAFLEDAEEYCGGDEAEVNQVAPTYDEMGEELASDGKRIGKRKKKKKRGFHKRGSEETGMSESGEDDYGGGEGENQGADSSGLEEYNNAEMMEEEESSIFGQTAGSNNATWVECDRCKKVRVLFYVTSVKCESYSLNDCLLLLLHHPVETPPRRGRRTKTAFQVVLLHEQKRPRPSQMQRPGRRI
jgi:hypothetical protein